MTEPHKCRIIIVDDHKAFTDGLRLVFKKMPDINLVGVYNNTDEYILHVEAKKPDIVLMDIDLKYSSMNGIEATKETLRRNSSIKIIAVSMHDDGYAVQQMLDAGACAYF